MIEQAPLPGPLAGGDGPRPGRRANTRAGEANRGRILDAALEAFSRHGLRGARLGEIAAAAGLSKTNLLYYFRSKDELYTAVVARTLAMWLEPLQALRPEREPEEALAAYIAEKLAFSRSQPSASRLFATEIIQGAPHLAPQLATALAAIFHDAVATIEAWIGAGRLKPLAPRHLLFTIWATTQHYADFSAQIEILTGRGLDDEAFFEEARRAATETILRGVLPDEAAARRRAPMRAPALSNLGRGG